MAELKVLVLADDLLARAGLGSILGADPALIVVGRFPLTGTLPAALSDQVHDVVVVDLGWEGVAGSARGAGGEGGRPGLERPVLEELADDGRPVLVLAPDAASAAAAWAAGARGVVHRETPPEQLVAAVKAVDAGLVVADPEFAAADLRPPSSGAPVFGDSSGALEQPDEPLTPRELEVLAALAQGLPNKQIAYSLGISEHTVKFHVDAILGKLGAASRTEAVVRAIRAGVIAV